VFLYPKEAPCIPQKGAFEPLFTEVPGRRILRTSRCWSSANFAITEFSEVRCFLRALTYLVPWRTYTDLRLEYAAFVT
jgi:hypothetical protein